MDKVIYNIEKTYTPKAIPSAIPLAYQALYMLNMKMQEMNSCSHFRVGEYGGDNLPLSKLKNEIPVKEKVTLTIKEAAEYSNIGINKLENLLKSPRCPFVLYVGKKKLVKRKEFEKFISENIEI